VFDLNYTYTLRHNKISVFSGKRLDSIMGYVVTDPERGNILQTFT